MVEIRFNEIGDVPAKELGMNKEFKEIGCDKAVHRCLDNCRHSIIIFTDVGLCMNGEVMVVSTMTT